MKVFILFSVVVTALASRECGENEHWESCGSACPLTCENYKNPPQFCILRCDIGCHCDKGYVRSSDGRCVKPEECPGSSQEVCGENQRYTTCGKACPLTCENYDNPPLICPLMCIIGCECQEGFVKTQDGRCVKPKDCPNRAQSVREGQERSSVCELPAETGRCLAYFPRYYFNQSTGKCEEFIYGGCAGNANNFKSIEECEATCS